MTVEEAKTFLHSIAGDLGSTNIGKYTCEDGEKMREAIKSLEQSRWIPISEKQPENSGVYIVTREFNDGVESADLTDACYFDGTCTWHNDNRINHSREYVDKKIKAWMPLPEPYNAETKPQKSSEEKSCNNCKWRNSDGCLPATCSMIGRDGHGLWERAESEGK